MQAGKLFTGISLLVAGLWGICLPGAAQPKLEFDLKKPKQFEERQLGSEKSAEKKFTIVRRFFQNTYTHYNYYFNANNLINEIVENARSGSKDDYTELLPYYNWSLEQTKGSALIDSILEKCTAGILLHDLRNDWIDNMYLLMGKAYYLRKDFDSAAMAFQFLNYAFAQKQKGGYDIPIGSNSEEKTNAFTILSKEKKHYYLSRPPSRNDGFIWQVRNLTDKKQYLDASSLIAVLRNDPNFPERLQPELNESIAYLNYHQQIWDSAAIYLEKAMPLATDASDRARRWYLTGQLYQLAAMPASAADAYGKCAGNALDPVMEVYARLNSIRLRKNDDPNIVQQNIDALLQMAKKDKYYQYRDIIYYAISLFEIERNGMDAAEGYLAKSIAVNKDNAGQRSLSWYQLGEVRYTGKKYGMVAPPYDSLQMSSLKPLQQETVSKRKPGVTEVYKADQIISLQDSLIKLADMPEDARTDLVKKLSKALRKARGLKEEEAGTGSVSVNALDPNKKPADLFATGGGAWYFYEPNRRAAGFLAFRERWGARPNEDNWRRSSELAQSTLNNNSMNLAENAASLSPIIQSGADAPFDTADVSFDNLYSRIPLSPERRVKAETQAINALYKKAAALHNQIEDYPEAIKVYEEILRRTDTGKLVQQTLFGLVHCYTQVGDRQKAAAASAKLEQMGGAAMLQKNEDAAAQKAVADAAYENIYNLFLEGNFDAALQARKQADSLLGKSYWKPQLLYLQSVYHIKNREDSLAIQELTNLKNQFGTHGLSEKATRMIDVLKRRSEIEAYLSKLEVTRASEDDIDPVVMRPSAQVIATLPAKQLSGKDSAAIKADAAAMEKRLKAEKEAADKARAETEAAALAAAEKAAAEKARQEKEAAEKALAEKQKAEKEAAEKALAEKQKAEKEAAEKAAAEKARLEKEAAAKELAQKQAEEKAKAEKALAEKQAAEKAALEKDAANKAEAERILAEKQKAEQEALNKALAEKQAAEKAKAEQELAAKMKAEQEKAARELEARQAAERAAAEQRAIEKAAADKAAAEAKQKMIDNVTVTTPVTASPYRIQAGAQQIVAIVLEKIDPAYVNEVSYSFMNSPLRNTPTAEVSVVKKKIRDGLWLVELHAETFTNMQAAYDYIKYIKPIAQSNLLSWLDASKYHFITISPENLRILETQKDAALYYQVLREAVPGKF